MAANSGLTGNRIRAALAPNVPSSAEIAIAPQLAAGNTPFAGPLMSILSGQRSDAIDQLNAGLQSQQQQNFDASLANAHVTQQAGLYKLLGSIQDPRLRGWFAQHVAGVPQEVADQSTQTGVAEQLSKIIQAGGSGVNSLTEAGANPAAQNALSTLGLNPALGLSRSEKVANIGKDATTTAAALRAGAEKAPKVAVALPGGNTFTGTPAQVRAQFGGNQQPKLEDVLNPGSAPAQTSEDTTGVQERVAEYASQLTKAGWHVDPSRSPQIVVKGGHRYLSIPTLDNNGVRHDAVSKTPLD
jgi:hypothetical protein